MHAPFTIRNLDHLVLRTGNGPRLITFYESLGCTVVRRVASVNLVQLHAGVSIIDIIEVPDGESAPTDLGRNLDHFALRIDPFDAGALVTFCTEQSIEYQLMKSPIFGADGFGPAIYLRDPDGNRVELKGPPVANTTGGPPAS
jgi:catechol 2,3-dioxygenase-like lactoylglutathione lyase family enzyme